MKPLVFFAFGLVLIFSCGNKEQVQNEIQASLDQCMLAVSTKNIELYMKGVPDDFEIKDENGEMITREMQRQFALRDWAIIDTTLFSEYRIDSLKVFNDSAVVFTSQKWERMMFRRDGITLDTVLTLQKHKEIIWKRRKGAWANYFIEELGGQIYLNGKEYIP